ncbi:hypothetical protein IC619_002650 [Hazenella sp. IB182353]|uniref:hypothetical protein n=1 Tax=Polycladospora coralii TaxID=2771432 RepID=UPI00174766B4|nr:hypothetical protein [Polycladospora coralii]MBS7529396.1 hypothetical protein [Polycladospora coralii]
MSLVYVINADFANPNGTVSVIDNKTNNIIANIQMIGNPLFIAMAPQCQYA